MSFQLGRLPVGDGSPCLLVAELSGNHNGDLGRAIATVEAAKEAGAHAIKLQTYTADTLTIRSDRRDFVVPGDGPWSGRTLYDLYQEAHTPWDWHPRLFETARRIGLEIFSTPFDRTAVDLLEDLGAPAHKVASFELVDDDLLRAVAATGKPIVISTGMASLEEIAHALTVLRGGGAADLVVLKCTSSYPAPDAAMDLAAIPLLARVTGCPAGLSDHSRGIVAPVVAATLGAVLIEKHFTLDRAAGGVDSHFSLEPAEFRELATAVARAQAMIGRPRLGPGTAEEGSVTFRRSLYVVADVAAGEPLTRANVRSIRPGFGLAPRFADQVWGRRASRAVERGTPVSWDLVGPAGDVAEVPA
ncbi:MAG: pseudaminic acid synthase [Gemmatimonadales bacterium]